MVRMKRYTAYSGRAEIVIQKGDSEMTEAWLVEAGKGIGRFFLNPIVYWVIILAVLAGYKRIKRERKQFGSKVFDLFAEWSNTWGISLIAGLLVSLIGIGAGLVLSYETILLASGMMILLSLTARFTMLSPSYTIGFTYLLLLFFPLLMDNQAAGVGQALFGEINFTGLTILLGVFLIVEAILFWRVKRNQTYPLLKKGSRGGWLGGQQMKKMAVIPFFALIPAGMLEPFAPFWPYFSVGGESYSLILMPFLLGFDYTVTSGIVTEKARGLAKQVLSLGLVVLLLAVGSTYLAWLSLAAVLVAVIGREFINYRHRIRERTEPPFYQQTAEGLIITGIIPRTSADRLDLLVGETITKVNGIKVSTETQFYHALQENGAYIKLEVLDDAREMRFVQGAIYEGDHHELGLLFTRAPHRREESA